MTACGSGNQKQTISLSDGRTWYYLAGAGCKQLAVFSWIKVYLYMLTQLEGIIHHWHGVGDTITSLRFSHLL